MLDDTAASDVALTWVPAGALADLAPGGARVVTHGGARIALFRLTDGSLAAIDDRCPHEGYPLAKGFVNQGVVTCRWHAFRYELKSGRCLVGDEHARAFPVRVVDGRVEVGVAPPDRAAARRAAEVSLEHGLERRRVGQVARDVVRLLEAGATPRDVVRHAIHYDAARAPYGTTHVPALAWDLLGRLPGIAARLGDDGVVAALMQPLDLCADPLARHPPRARPAPEDPGPDDAAALVALRARVEAEDAEGAEALVRGAVARGVPLATLAGWMQALVDDHLLDFGHAAIYLPKLVAWLADEEPAALDLVLGAFTRGIAMGTREELVPEWGAYLRHLDDGLAAPPAELSSLARALLDGPRDMVLPAVRRALADHPREAVIDQIVLAASVHLLRYDLAIERDPTVQEGWLDITHGLTLASALRAVALPGTPRLVLLAAAFVHGRRGANAPEDLRPWDEVTHAPRRAFGAGDGVDVEEALQLALDARDADGVMRPADRLARDRPDALVDLLEDWCLTRGAGRAIFQAHQHKTMIAALAESKALAARAPALAHVPLVAAARFVAAPYQERSIMRLAHEANRFVKLSRVPRRLT